MKKKSKIKSKIKLVAKPSKTVKAPLESPGSYYLRVRESGSWAVMLETYLSGKRKQRTIQESMYSQLGFLKTMTGSNGLNWDLFHRSSGPMVQLAQR